MSARGTIRVGAGDRTRPLAVQRRDDDPPVPPDQPIDPVEEPPDAPSHPGTPDAPVREPGPEPPTHL